MTPNLELRTLSKKNSPLLLIAIKISFPSFELSKKVSLKRQKWQEK